MSLDAFSIAQMRLAAGLRPNPLGELERSPRPPSRNWGRDPTSKGNGQKEGMGERKGRGCGEKVGMVSGGVASYLFNFCYA